MKTSLTAFIRLTTFAGVGLVAIAVGLGSHNGARRAVANTGSRTPAPALSYVATANNHAVRLLDAQTGHEVRIDFPENLVVDQVSCAPWQDGDGHRRMIGRWQKFRGRGTDAIGDDFGLALMQYPDGRCLMQVRTDILPVTPPCWFPDSATRVLFAAGDGRLYHYDFAAEEDTTGLMSRAPEPVRWEVPGENEPALILDPSWSPADVPGGILLATISRNLSTGKRAAEGEIWWLKLDDTGSRVVQAGRLTTPVDERDGETHEEARAMICGTAAGDLTLMYQSRRAGTIDWQLRIARVTRPGDSPAPTVGPASEIDPGPRVGQLGNFAMSGDGRWIYAIRRNWGMEAEVRRLPVESIWLARGDMAADEAH